jgi:GNAT superfamily N-acetyltransferase
MDTISFREARLDDVPELMRLIGQSDMSPDNSLTLERASDLVAGIAETGCHKIFVAELDGAIIGTFVLLAVQSLTHNGGRSCVIEDVVIQKDLQGQGLGRYMMNHAVDSARALGCSKMVLSSGKARTKAHTFYEGLGFEKDGYRFALNLTEEIQ